MGVGIKATKTTNFKKTNNKKNIFDSIPDELIIDIVARVAASSSCDLFKTKFRYFKICVYRILIKIYIIACLFTLLYVLGFMQLQNF